MINTIEVGDFTMLRIDHLEKTTGRPKSISTYALHMTGGVAPVATLFHKEWHEWVEGKYHERSSTEGYFMENPTEPFVYIEHLTIAQAMLSILVTLKGMGRIPEGIRW